MLDEAKHKEERRQCAISQHRIDRMLLRAIHAGTLTVLDVERSHCRFDLVGDMACGFAVSCNHWCGCVGSDRDPIAISKDDQHAARCAQRRHFHQCWPDKYPDATGETDPQWMIDGFKAEAAAEKARIEAWKSEYHAARP